MRPKSINRGDDKMLIFLAVCFFMIGGFAAFTFGVLTGLPFYILTLLCGMGALEKRIIRIIKLLEEKR